MFCAGTDFLILGFTSPNRIVPTCTLVYVYTIRELYGITSEIQQSTRDSAVCIPVETIKPTNREVTET